MNPRVMSLADAVAKLPQPDGRRSTLIVNDPNLALKLYAPRGTDPQTRNAARGARPRLRSRHEQRPYRSLPPGSASDLTDTTARSAQEQVDSSPALPDWLCISWRSREPDDARESSRYGSASRRTTPRAPHTERVQSPRGAELDAGSLHPSHSACNGSDCYA